MNPLPTLIDPGRLADDGGRIHGELELAGLGRVAAACMPGTNAVVVVDLQFSRDRQGRRQMHGTVTLQAQLPCARCLQAVDFGWVAHPNVLWVRPGETEENGTCEVVEWSMPVALVTVVEEELLLALPMMVTHEGDCMAGVPS